MTRPDAAGPLRTQMTRLSLRQFVDLITAGRVVPVGPPGAGDWTTQQRTDVWHSLESGWPIGLLTMWRPQPTGRYHLLDGHRRTATLIQTTTDDTRALLRDLTSGAPAYRVAANEAPCLPTTAMLSTLNFLTATRHLPDELRRHAEQIANRVHHAPVDVLSLCGGTPWEVSTLCGRLLGSRVARDTVITLHRTGG